MAQILTVVITPVFYLGPVTYAIFLIRIIYGEVNAVKLLGSFDLWNLDNQVAWLYLEVQIFFFSIFSLMVFLLGAYIRKYKSLWKGSYDSAHSGFEALKDKDMLEDNSISVNNDDLWNGKKTDDFLRYLKWEAF